MIYFWERAGGQSNINTVSSSHVKAVALLTKVNPDK